MHAPHYTSTVCQPTLLGDLGATAQDERVVRGVETVLATQREDGGFAGHDPDSCAHGPYDVGLVVRFIHQFGLGDDSRVERMCQWIEEKPTGEGGWAGAKGYCQPAAGAA